MLIQIWEIYEMKNANGFFGYKNIHDFTWNPDTRNLRSKIDYVIIKTEK